MFIDKQEFDNLPYLEKNKDWLLRFEKFNTASAIIEFISTSCYVLIFFFGITISARYLILSFLFSIIMSIFFVGITAWLVSSQRLAMRKLIGAFDTKPKADDIIYAIAIIAITVILFWTGQKGDELIFSTVNSYTPNTEEYTQNSDYIEKKSTKYNIERSREIAIKAAQQSVKDCSECKLIEGFYASKFAAIQRKKITKFKANEIAWANSVNSKLNADIAQIQSKMQGEKQAANGRAEIRRDSILQSYESLSFSADTAIIKHQTKIDSANIAEQNKKQERDKSNILFAGLMVLFTQLLFFVGSIGQAWIYRKAKKMWHDIESELGGSDFTKPIIMFFDVILSKVSQKIGLYMAGFMAEGIMQMQEKKDKAFVNEHVKVIYENKAKSMKEAAYLLSKTGAVNNSIQIVENNETQIVENKIEENNDISEENTDISEESDITLTGNETFLTTIETIIRILENLRSLYDEMDFIKIEEIIEILKNLKKL